MGSQPTIEIIELHLREFCEASLELLAGQGSRESVLADVLPSFARAIRACGRASKPLAKELHSWQQKSQQLGRLAALHCGNDSEGLVASLEQISREATRAMEALSNLAAEGDVVALPAEEETVRLMDSAELPLTQTEILKCGEQVEFNLQQFCEAVLVLLQAGPDNSSVLPQTVPSLYHVFSACGTVELAQLRAELNVSRTTAEQLLQFADAHGINSVEQLEERIRQAQECVERLINAMESLAWAAAAVGKNPGRQIPLSSNGIVDDVGDSANSSANEEDRAQAQKLYRLAIESHQRQDFQTAETLYSESLRLDSTLRLAWLQRGRIRLLNAEANLAVADLTRTLQLFAADPIALRWRADALAICGRFEEALNDYDLSLQILPESSIVRYNRAVVLRLMGRLDCAWTEFEQFLQQRTNRPGAHLNRGLICLVRKQDERAIQEFKAALAVQPGLPEAIERLKQLGVNFESDPTPKKRSAGTAKVPLKSAKPRSAGLPRASSGSLRRLDPNARLSGEIRVQSALTQMMGTPDQNSPKSFDDEQAVAVLSETTIPEKAIEPHNSSVIDRLETASSSTAEQVAATTAPVVSTLAVNGNGTASDAAAGVASGTPSRSDPAQATMEIRCPECFGVSSIQWGQLQTGKMISCRRCDCRLAVQSDGTLVRMVKNRRGQWSQHRNHFEIWKDRRILATVASVIVLASIFFFRPLSADNFIPEDPGYPKELEPRAKLFTLAWLKGDFRTMRQLTDAVHSQELHLWAMDNPAPVVASLATLERDATLNVEIVNAIHPNARLQVRIDGLRIERGHPVSELAQHWKQEGERWMFQPTSRSNL